MIESFVLGALYLVLLFLSVVSSQLLLAVLLPLTTDN